MKRLLLPLCLLTFPLLVMSQTKEELKAEQAAKKRLDRCHPGPGRCHSGRDRCPAGLERRCAGNYRI